MARVFALYSSRRTTRKHIREFEHRESVRLVARIIELAKAYGRYGYRRITALLQRDADRTSKRSLGGPRSPPQAPGGT